MTLNKLRQQAHRAAAARGHRMTTGKAVKVGEARWVYDYPCHVCGMEVRVNPNPAPNEIDIGGAAVALVCKSIESTIEEV